MLIFFLLYKQNKNRGSGNGLSGKIDLAIIVEEKVCPFSNELLINFIGVSLKFKTATKLFSKT